MVLSAQTIRKLRLLNPCREPYRDACGNSAGLSACGYDLTIAEDVRLDPGDFKLASAQERFDLPSDICGIVHDKSSWARRGLTVQNTVAEPGWRGFLTIELSNHSTDHFHISSGQAIAQVVFHWLDLPTELPYVGKYQDQEPGPQSARAGFPHTTISQSTRARE